MQHGGSSTKFRTMLECSQLVLIEAEVSLTVHMTILHDDGILTTLLIVVLRLSSLIHSCLHLGDVLIEDGRLRKAATLRSHLMIINISAAVLHVNSRRHEIVVGQMLDAAIVVNVIALLDTLLLVEIVLIAVPTVRIVRIREVSCDCLLVHLGSLGLRPAERVTLLELCLLVQLVGAVGLLRSR